MKLTDYRGAGRPQKEEKTVRKRSSQSINKQCFNCLWLHCKYWDCIHDDQDKYIIYSDERRDFIQNISDYEKAYFHFMKNRGKRNIDKENTRKPKSKNDHISADKFRISIIF
jgi:hypothetical protein